MLNLPPPALNQGNWSGWTQLRAETSQDPVGLLSPALSSSPLIVSKGKMHPSHLRAPQARRAGSIFLLRQLGGQATRQSDRDKEGHFQRSAGTKQPSQGAQGLLKQVTGYASSLVSAKQWGQVSLCSICLRNASTQDPTRKFSVVPMRKSGCPLLALCYEERTDPMALVLRKDRHWKVMAG